MSEFSSYYLYQRYEKRGSQDWMPCVPNVYSITGDTNIPMPASAKSECDPQCGCSTVQYRWVNIDPSLDWICDGTSKYYKQRREVSYDGGTTWIPLDEYQKGALIETSSSDCTSPTPTIYRWVQTEDTVCVENTNSTYTKYYVYKKQQQVNGQWTDVSPAVTKPDGSPLGTYNTLAQCQGLEPQYRWYASGYTCVGYDKWVQSVKQMSYDGVNWETVIPVETSATSLVETNSEYCGYVPPTPTGATKFRATYSGGSTYELECDDNPTLTSGDTSPSGYGTDSMLSAEIGDCVTSIGYDAFEFYYNLSSVTFSSSVTSIGDNAFRWCYGISAFTIPNTVTTIGESAFQGCTAMTSIVIPDSVTSIGSYCFYGCRGLTSIDIPSSITIINVGTFMSCYALSSVTIPNTVTVIDNQAFEFSNHLTGITIPNSVTTIGRLAFNWCTGMTSITIGSSVTSIGFNAFYGNTGATSITCLATTPPTLQQAPSEYGYDYPFDNTNNAPIYVPSQSVNSYKSSWSMYSDRIVTLI